MAAISSFPRSGNNNPTTKNLKLARRSAARMRAIAACPPCKAIKQKCDNLRPCSRCKRIGREARCLSTQDEDSGGDTTSSFHEIERPVQFSHLFEMSKDEMPVPGHLILKYEWSQTTVMRYWKSGYRCDDLAGLFNSLPNPLPSLLELAFSSLVPREIKSINAPAPHPAAAAAAPAGADPNFCEESFWESERVYGCIEISFDPATGQRKRIFLNPRFADIYGFHREELVARLANRDAELQRTEVDLLLLLIDGLQHTLDNTKLAAVERYFRIFSGPHKAPLLVWSLWSKAVDPAGQFFKGSMIVKIISPDDYDAAVRRTPHACPLYSAGDHRTGRQLLEELEADRSLRVDQLARDPRSLRLLSHIVAFLDRLLATLPAPAAPAAFGPRPALAPPPRGA